MKYVKLSARFLTIVIATALVLGLVYFGIVKAMTAVRVYLLPENKVWEKESTPLPSDTVNDLCQKLVIENDPLCQNEQSVYAPDFFPAINKTFEKNITTYQDVQVFLDNYQVELESIEKDSSGEDYFLSLYDIRGDGVTGILMLFYGTYEKNLLHDIRFKYTNKPGL